ncbi:ice-binding family protein [Nonomuraea sp. NPDC052129]|uniref:ice-binding family protein n=1 Tax=Nonomuraea sp. NPDC052129 TaxID=3154651 RepID=UPI00341F8C2D
MSVVVDLPEYHAELLAVSPRCAGGSRLYPARSPIEKIRYMEVISGRASHRSRWVSLLAGAFVLVVAGALLTTWPSGAKAAQPRSCHQNEDVCDSPATSISGDLEGMTLEPGVYTAASSIELTGTVTLDAQGDPDAVFIFQIGTAFFTGPDSDVELVGGAQDCNVFWEVGNTVTTGAMPDVTVPVDEEVDEEVNEDRGRPGTETAVKDDCPLAHQVTPPALPPCAETPPVRPVPTPIERPTPAQPVKPAPTPKVVSTPQVDAPPKVVSTPQTVTPPKVVSTPQTVTPPKVVSTPKTVATPQAVATPKVTSTPTATATSTPTATSTSRTSTPDHHRDHHHRDRHHCGHHCGLEPAPEPVPVGSRLRVAG